MRPQFTDAQEAAMKAASIVVQAWGFKFSCVTCSKNAGGGYSKGGGALRYKRGKIQTCTVGPNWTYFCCVDQRVVTNEDKAPTADLEAVRKMLDRHVVLACPPPTSSRDLGRVKADDGPVSGLRFSRATKARAERERSRRGELPY